MIARYKNCLKGKWWVVSRTLKFKYCRIGYPILLFALCIMGFSFSLWTVNVCHTMPELPLKCKGFYQSFRGENSEECCI